MSYRSFPLLLIPALLLVACEPAKPVVEYRFDVANLLSQKDNMGYALALSPRSFRFPADHGPHPDFRNEWWYLTGNLDSEAGERFGYQVTFFRSAVTPRETPRRSAWAGRQIWMAHVAVTDTAAGRHHAAERFSREGPGLAGAVLSPFRVWLEEWSIAGNGDAFPWRIRVNSDRFSLDLSLHPEKPPVLQGEKGLSRKSSARGNASYYYSIPRLLTSGVIETDGSRHKVSGRSWLDREWSTSALSEDQAGWDWFALQLDDGYDLMFYRIRRKDGTVDRQSTGSLGDRSGRKTQLSPEDLSLQPLSWWTAPDGSRFPISWRLTLKGLKRTMEVRAAIPNQLMDLSVKYWEGAVDVFAPHTNQTLGRGYLELTGYKGLGNNKLSNNAQNISPDSRRR